MARIKLTHPHALIAPGGGRRLIGSLFKPALDGEAKGFLRRAGRDLPLNNFIGLAIPEHEVNYSLVVLGLRGLMLDSRVMGDNLHLVGRVQPLA